jgi:hypothetical protein
MAGRAKAHRRHAYTSRPARAFWRVCKFPVVFALEKVACLAILLIVVFVRLLSLLIGVVTRVWYAVVAAVSFLRRAPFDHGQRKRPIRNVDARLARLLEEASKPPQEKELNAAKPRLQNLIRDPEFISKASVRQRLASYQALQEERVDFETQLNVIEVLRQRRKDINQEKAEPKGGKLAPGLLRTCSPGGRLHWLRPPSQFTSTLCILALFVHPVLLRSQLEMFHCKSVSTDRGRFLMIAASGW